MKSLNMCTQILLFLFSLTSCSQMYTHRDYLSEMEHDDSSFYRPNVDFPVMAGDSGRTWESTNERVQRTPATESEKQDQRNAYFLKQELKRLESKQSDGSYELYQKYKHQLATTSERIYFLKLPTYERKDYLASRGFINTDSTVSYSYHGNAQPRQQDISLGMSKSDVMNHLGHPTRVEVAGNPSYENERWLYTRNGASNYVYFEAGHVEGWE
jgi:hypothetical protein